LKLPKYHYGGLGFRGHWTWNGKDKTFFLTSGGETDRVKETKPAGAGATSAAMWTVRALASPSCVTRKFRAPQPMRRIDEPFFCFAPSQLGDWEISPGKPYVVALPLHRRRRPRQTKPS